MNKNLSAHFVLLAHYFLLNATVPHTESLPIKTEPSPYVARFLSNLDVTTSSKDAVLAAAKKTVMDY